MEEDLSLLEQNKYYIQPIQYVPQLTEDNKYVIKISWQNIINIFYKQYEKKYFTNNKHKLYFSFSEKVEGCCSYSWCFLAFIDGILQNIEPDLINISARRLFSQKQIIIDCIQEELLKNINYYKMHNITLTRDNICVIIENTSIHWLTYDNLYQYLKENNRKSNKIIVQSKYITIVDKILSHLTNYGTSTRIIEIVVSIIIEKLAKNL
jgi:hypothetical protein